MKHKTRQDLSAHKQKSLSVVLLVSNYVANEDLEHARARALKLRLLLASRSLVRLAAGALGLAAVGNLQTVAYGEGARRKHLFAFSLRQGFVGGAQDMQRALSRHPLRPSVFRSLALSHLTRDLHEEFNRPSDA